MPGNTGNGKGLHPTFRKRPVKLLECRVCSNRVCTRGMKAILLADTSVELFSTDIPPPNAVDLVDSPYSTEKCSCRIKDFACLHCGSVVGYTVVQPCRTCLQSCNNGHLWMYNSEAVVSYERTYTSVEGCDILQWGQLLDCDDGLLDPASIELDEECIR